ncbi:protein kinase domain-containing protein [Neorhodopirellula pilleata]|uniref:Serine/threonine-protein kinase PknB n=1 Tax=Neorhodopirellula pilleata TaxID=2714738 RepID=A0A5C6AQE4_9BACT|nr:protein kinase [Neorhodopirellula pilleata]TWU01778.1 Serine/threonine-protein kinase PknB [Neorhodopirellula pilleata]
MKLLVADDNPVWRKLIEAAVVPWGYRVIVAENGRQALDALRSDDPPRLALLDWQMPEIEGVEICRQIKQDPDHPFTYVILLTSRDRDEDMIAGLDAGADDYLTKPIVAAMLKSRLAAAKRIVEAVPPVQWTKPQVDDFEIEKIIGRGAFATVWRARHLVTGKLAAVKIIRADLATDTVFERFAREVDAMRKMDHPGIAQIYASRLDRESAYYAMELIDGRSLGHYVANENPKATRIIEMHASICDALHHAHQRGIIHRDVKPSNVMVTEQGHPKLVDFGLCKSMFVPDRNLSSSTTIEGAVLGTPMFMSPEQARGELDKVDHRSDLYAIATMLYLFLLREHPHGANMIGRDEMIQTIATTPAIRARSINEKFNPNLDDLLAKCLASEPDERFQTAGELAAALRSFLHERRISIEPKTNA